MINTKLWETPLSWHAKNFLPVAVRVSKTRVLKLPIILVYLNGNNAAEGENNLKYAIAVTL